MQHLEILAIDRPRPIERNRQSEQLKSLAVFQDIATFRVILPRDLAAQRYGGSMREMWTGVKDLKRQGLIESRPHIDDRAQKSKIDVLVLTDKGAEFAGRGGTVYRAYRKGDARMLRRRELMHDAAVYPATRAAIARIESRGGQVEKVVIDQELKGLKAKLNNRAADGRKANESPSLAERRQIADRLKLPMVGGKVMIPDAQIHYRDRRGIPQVENVEVITRSYSAAAVSAKASSGFSIHGSCGAGSGSVRPNTGPGAPMIDDSHRMRW